MPLNSEIVDHGCSEANKVEKHCAMGSFFTDVTVFLDVLRTSFVLLALNITTTLKF